MLPSAITCQECQRGGTHYQCEDCCVRYIRRLISLMSVYGTPGHEDRIKDRLVQVFVDEVKD